MMNLFHFVLLFFYRFRCLGNCRLNNGTVFHQVASIFGWSVSCSSFGLHNSSQIIGLIHVITILETVTHSDETSGRILWQTFATYAKSS